MNRKLLMAFCVIVAVTALTGALLGSMAKIRQLKKELAWWRCERQYAQPQEPVLVEEVTNARTYKE